MRVCIVFEECLAWLWVGEGPRVFVGPGVFVRFVRNVHVHDFASLDGGRRRRGCGMNSGCRYLKLVCVVKGRPDGR